MIGFYALGLLAAGALICISAAFGGTSQLETGIGVTIGFVLIVGGCVCACIDEAMRHILRAIENSKITQASSADEDEKARS